MHRCVRIRFVNPPVDRQVAAENDGRTVYTVTSNPGSGQLSVDGIARNVGEHRFRAAFVVSNVSLTNNVLFSVDLGTGDTGSTGIVLSIVRDSPSCRAQLFDDIGSRLQFAGEFSTTDPVTCATLYLDYAPDLINGGSLYDAFVEFNESGVIIHVSSIDGLQLPSNATSGRSVFLRTSGARGACRV